MTLKRSVITRNSFQGMKAEEKNLAVEQEYRSVQESLEASLHNLIKYLYSTLSIVYSDQYSIPSIFLLCYCFLTLVLCRLVSANPEDKWWTEGGMNQQFLRSNSTEMKIRISVESRISWVSFIAWHRYRCISNLICEATWYALNKLQQVLATTPTLGKFFTSTSSWDLMIH